MRHLSQTASIVSFLFLLLFLSATGFAAENSCVSCHEKLKGDRYKVMAHNFDDWKKSVHAKNAVTCEACHGGNPKAADPVKAHQGVSSIHFQKVPETCGKCHAEELREFKKSVHYKMLERNGKGPNCLTCHGSMATRILSPADLDQTCSLCHGKPTRAAKALSLIRSLENVLGLYHKKHPSEEKTYAEFLDRYQKIQREWHSFDVVFVIEESEKLIQEVKGAMKP